MKWDNAKYAEPSTSFFCLLAVCFCCNADGKGRTDPGWISRIAVRTVYWFFYHRSKHWGLALLPFSDYVSSTPSDKFGTETGNLKIRTEKRVGGGVEGVTCPRYESGSYIDKFRCLTLSFRKLKNLSVTPQNPKESNGSLYFLFWMRLLWILCPAGSATEAGSKKSRRSLSRSMLVSGPRLPWTMTYLWTWPLTSEPDL